MGKPKAERPGVNESTYIAKGPLGFIDWLGPPTVADDGELEAGHGACNQYDA
jgi:hypothetical protein